MLLENNIENIPSEIKEKCPKDINDYIHDKYRNFALQEISKVQPVIYFQPLLKEMFCGQQTKTKIVFTILHSLMTDDRISWTRNELDEKFHWLKSKHLNYLMQRLSTVGWLEYQRDRNTYMISDKGEALMRILSRFTMGSELVNNEGAALAEIEFSVLLEAKDVPDRLKFLRNRLNKHIARAEHALESESPYIILEIYEQLKSAYRWAEQTRKAMDQLVVEDDDKDMWNGIRDIHDHLSRLHALISKMQITLQDIQNKQIDIASYGLSHLDFDHYLLTTSIDNLSDMIEKNIQKIPHPLFLINTTVFQEIHGVVNREKEVAAMRGWNTNAVEAETNVNQETAEEADDFNKDLTATKKSWTDLNNFLNNVEWDIAAYRFSLLTLLADRDDRVAKSAESAFDPIISVPVEVEFAQNQEMSTVKYKGETRQFSKGKIRRLK